MPVFRQANPSSGRRTRLQTGDLGTLLDMNQTETIILEMLEIDLHTEKTTGAVIFLQEFFFSQMNAALAS